MAMKAYVAILLSLFIMSSYDSARKNPVGPPPKRAHPVPGTSIIYFAELEEGLYKGSKPKTNADYRFLQAKKVKNILDLKFFPLLYRLEKNKADQYGMAVIPATINASPVAPSEEHVRKILCILADKKMRPLYFHCDVGRDRTSLIATLYEIYFQGLPAEKAEQEMKHLGFKDDWTLHGLKSYLQKHSNSAFVGSCSR
jgi:rhodanese/phosphatase family protein